MVTEIDPARPHHRQHERDRQEDQTAQPMRFHVVRDQIGERSINSDVIDDVPAWKAGTADIRYREVELIFAWTRPFHPRFHEERDRAGSPTRHLEKRLTSLAHCQPEQRHQPGNRPALRWKASPRRRVQDI